MKEKKITCEEFNQAVKAVIAEWVNDPDLEGIEKLLIPMTGASFASKVRKILFEKEND